MHRDQVISVVRAHEAELRAAGVLRLRLFGSVARGEQTAESDIDLAVDMDPSRGWGLLTLGGLHADLSEWLGQDVDLSVLDWFRPALRERVLREAVDAL